MSDTLTVQKPKIGRPTLKTPELCAEICDRLSSGETLFAICKDSHMPSCVTVFNWLKRDEQFLNDYAHARGLQADFMADEIMEIAKSASAGDANAVRVRLDALKWYAGKIAPKKYGDKPAETHITTAVNNNVVLLSAERQAELQERRKRLLGEGQITE